MKFTITKLLAPYCLITFFAYSQQVELALPTSNLDVGNVRYSPDGKTIITTSSDLIAKIWDVQSGRKLYNLKGHADRINSTNFSANGKLVITASNDHTSKVWEVQSGLLLLTLRSDAKANEAIFNTTGDRVAISLGDASVEIWDAREGKLLHTLKGHTEEIKSLNYSPDGKMLATAAWDGTVIIWNSLTGTQMITLREEGLGVDGVAYGQDPTKVLTWGNSVKIWDTRSGKPVQTLVAKKEGSQKPFDASFKAAYSKNGAAVVSYSDNMNTSWDDRKTQVWDALTAKLICEIGRSSVSLAKFSPDGKTITTVYQNIVELWDAQSGKLLNGLSEHKEQIWDVDFSPDGKQIVTCSQDRTTKIWDVKTGSLLRSLEGSVKILWNAKYSPNGETLLVFYEYNILKLWDMKNGRLLHVLDSKAEWADAATYSPDSKTVAIANSNGATIWDVSSGSLRYNLHHEGWGVKNIRFSPDGKTMVAAYRFSARVWDVQTGKLIRTLSGHTSSVKDAVFSPDGKIIVTISEDNTAKVSDVQTGKLFRTLEGHTKQLETATFSPDGSRIVTASWDNTAKIWDIQSGNLILTLEGHDWYIGQAIFSPDGKKVVTASGDKTAKLWDAQSGSLISNWDKHEQKVIIANYSPDGRTVLTASEDQSARIWNAHDSQLQKTILLNGVGTDIAPGGQQIVSHDYSSLHFLDLKTGDEVIRLAFLSDADWVVTHGSGLFDASPGALEKLYFVQGLETIELTQLKERYYEPGLWRKVMGGEKLRSVIGMKAIELPPDIRVGQVDLKGYLPVELINKGGGIGDVSILINGKEIIADARPKGSNSKASKMSLNVFIGNHKALIKGVENMIAVKAWNEGHWVVSRSTLTSYTLDGNEKAYQPAIHIITCGVSDYTGNELDLRYAAKDAQDVSRALHLGARDLFGDERTFIYNLTTSSIDQIPTKANILKTFDKVSAQAHPLDVMVVYLSGHGINHGGSEGDWYYLTQDAYTSNVAAYNDPEIRRTTTLSSVELVELFKKVPTLKQVLMIDACASGKVVENLMAKRDVESSTLRALDRMRDRTGLHIITGCTADAVSYEASKYGQGVLTYSLLEGIRGASLRENQICRYQQAFSICA